MHALRKPDDNGPTIDYYDNAEGWKPTATCTLGDLIDGIRGDDFAEKVAEVRDLIDQGDKAAADAIKKTLPAVSLSGCITGRRKAAVADGRFQHSGLLQIDLDAKDNPGWSLAALRTVLENDDRMVAVFLSPSGNGMKGVARIPAEATTHKAAFLAAEAHFKTLNLKIDPSCKDPVRLCFVSHDPGAWLRMDTSAMFEPVELEFVENLDDEAEEDAGKSPLPEREASIPAYRVSTSGGIVIRGNSQRELDAATVREMLACIPYPGYDKWLKITNAVWDALGEDGTPILQAWAPEKKPGDYAEKFAHRLTDVRAATLVMFAKEHGWAPTVTSSVRKPTPKLTIAEKLAGGEKSVTDSGKVIPSKIFPVPNGNVGNDLAATHIFSVISPSLRLFMREGTVFEVDDKFNDGGDGHARLIPMIPSRFTSEIERFGAKVMALETTGKDQVFQWRTRLMGENHCRMLLDSTAAREHLPPIRQLAAAPVLVSDGNGGTVTLGRGWHAHAGGTFVTGKQNVPEVSLDEACLLLGTVLQDFNFTSPPDGSRALASLLSPAMKLGGWIDDDFPLDVAEADQSQAGKSYRHKLVAAIYGETPFQITNSTGGVGSLDERVAGALIAGRPIITLENIRGRIDSQTLESAIRGVGRVTARSFRACVEVDTSPFIWQFSTNGAELTPDLANRSIFTRIRKRESGYEYQKFPEGAILQHVRANQPRFLSAVHAIIREWVRLGCQRSCDGRHDFRQWVQVMDWIVQNIFEFPPLLDGHREEQLRSSSPKLQWLRDVIHAIVTDGRAETGLSASDLAEAAEEHDLPLPGRRDSVEAMEVRVGKLLGRLFREAETNSIIVDGRVFTRQEEVEWCPINRTNRTRKIYVIGMSEQPKNAVQNEVEQPELL